MNGMIGMVVTVDPRIEGIRGVQSSKIIVLLTDRDGSHYMGEMMMGVWDEFEHDRFRCIGNMKDVMREPDGDDIF